MRHTKLLVIALLTSSAWVSPALGQSAPLPAPVYTTVDANHVDLVTGQVSYSFEEGHVGSGPGAVGMQRIWAESAGWVDNWTGGLFTVTHNAVKQFYVQVNGASDTFTWATGSGPYTNTKGTGTTLIKEASGKYLYTAMDGTTIEFDVTNTNSATSCPGADANTCNIPINITQPNGLNFKLSWTENTSLGMDYVRLDSVESSARYRMEISYLTNAIGPGPSPDANWFKRQKLQFFNLARSTALLGETDYAYPSTGVTTVTDPALRTWTLTQDSAGRLTGVRRPGNSVDNLTYVYDPTSSLVTKATVDGVPTSYAQTYSNYMYTMTITDAAGKQSFVSTPAPLGRPVTFKDALNRTTTYNYVSQNANALLKSITLPRGNSVTYTYDARGNVTDTTYTDTTGTKTITTHASFEEPTCTNPRTCNKPSTTTDANGYVTQYAYNPTHGGLISVKPPKPSSSSTIQPETDYTYAHVTSASGDLVYMPAQISSCQTGNAGSCSGTTDQTLTTFSSYDGNLLPGVTSRRDGPGTILATTKLTYDAHGNITYADGPISGTADTWAYKYDAADQRVGLISPDPDATGPLIFRALRTTYRPDGQVSKREIGTAASQSDADFANMSVTQEQDIFFDANSRPKLVRAVGGVTRYTQTQLSYDQLGRLDCTAVRMDQSEFNNDANLTACTAGANTSPRDRISRNVYDDASELVQVRVQVGANSASDPGVAERTMSYTPNGKLDFLIDGEGQKSEVKYDGFDRQECLIYPSAVRPSSYNDSTQATALATAGAVSGDCISGGDYDGYTYDDAGNVLTHRNRSNQTTAFTYDHRSRVILKDLPGTEYDVSYAYDNLSRLTDATQKDSAGATVEHLIFTYDALGRNLTQGGPQGTICSTWDLAGRRTSLRYPGPPTCTGNYLIDYTYLLTGEMTQVQEDGGTVLATYSYDNLGNRMSLTYGNNVVASYTYDGLSRLTSLNNQFTDNTNDLLISGMNYNPASQLVSANRSNTAYSWTAAGSGSTTYTPNGLNEYSTIGGVAPTYDANGNMKSDPQSGKNYLYTSENQLRVATGGGAPGVTLTYDPAMRLYEDKVTNTPTIATRFAYDGSQMIAEFDGNNVLQKRYVFGAGLDEPIVQLDAAGNHTWLTADERGSVIAHSDSAGNLVQINKYDEYGKPQPGNAGRFQYTGQEWIEDLGTSPASGQGLYYYKARMYSPHLGRFMQTDPIGVVGGLNLYEYVKNDPVNMLDPLGLQTVCTGTTCIDPTTYVVTGSRDPNPGNGWQDQFQLAYDFLYNQNPGQLMQTAYVGDGFGGAGTGGTPAGSNSCPTPPLGSRGKAIVDSNIDSAIRSRALDARNNFSADFAPFSGAAAFFGQVMPFGPQDYKRSMPGPGADVFGNFNFGAVGAANGWSLSALLRGSRGAQIFENLLHGEVRFSDNPDDPTVIAQGYKYFANGCYER